MFSPNRTFKWGLMLSRTFFALALLILGGMAHADTLADDVLNTLYTMKGVYRAEYAPAAWKKQFAGYDLDTEFSKAVAAVQANPQLTQADAVVIFKNFVYAMKDYHTSISFMGTEAAKLPLVLGMAADGRFFIAAIDRTRLPEGTFPFHEGDEVVTFGDQPTAQAVDDIQAAVTSNVPATDRSLATIRLTARSAARGLLVPHGPITLGIRPIGATDVTLAQLIWEYTPESIAPRGTLLAGALDQPSTLFHPRMDVELGNRKSAETPFDLGVRKSFIPALGTKIWESADDSQFYAYIYKTADRKLIGYVRIPEYGADDLAKATVEFGKIITRFEATTDSMVIDQVNNPGGSVFYLYTLASMLSDKPLATPRHRMAIDQSSVSDALATITKLKDIKTDAEAQKALPAGDLDGYPASYEFVQFTLSYAHFIVDQWNQGHKLTTPYWIGGVDHINPAAVHYTKPILLLINHLDFSGGDFFPTILQDNKRVTILGSRTAGAGGYVNDVKIQNNVGIAAFRCTESIAERVSGHPIENLGVTPDIAYELTAEDFQKSFAPYVKVIQDAVATITP
jgi:hypothetical protein